MRRSRFFSGNPSINVQEIAQQTAVAAAKGAANAIRKEMATPVAAGGRREDSNPTLSQDMLQFLDGIDEVPERLLPNVWSLITRHNQLTNVAGTIDHYKLMAGVRMQLRPLVWRGILTVSDMNNIMYYVGIQLRKSLHRGERLSLAPNHTELIREEYSSDNNTLIPSQGGGNFAAQGALNKIGFRRGGNRYG